MTRQRERIHGLYGITDSGLMLGPALLEKAEVALRAGLRLLQYRDKGPDDARRQREAAALLALCEHYDALLVINDDPDLTHRIGAKAIHVGEEDAGIADLRAILGPDVLIGVSCYNDLARADRLAAAGADYLAFGAVYPSPTKPQARHAALSLFTAARPLELPLVAIGGITQDNVADVAAAGADAAAVISALFGAADVAAATQRLQAPFRRQIEETP
ncbi:thiamine phosphate synthase [Acidithiobacillus sp. IBUN Pt1247-S3]|uniref:thiamine phosphate synthase n=1 Tax=Acidithiobacillus sp. IBUN Pt1247-S3 TaxID=3166642 RepID=UPI0034E4A25D